MYIEEKIVTPIKDNFDVIVAGGGVAGIAAALAAARQGAKAALLRNKCLFGLGEGSKDQRCYDRE